MTIYLGQQKKNQCSAPTAVWQHRPTPVQVEITHKCAPSIQYTGTNAAVLSNKCVLLGCWGSQRWLCISLCAMVRLEAVTLTGSLALVLQWC